VVAVTDLLWVLVTLAGIACVPVVAVAILAGALYRRIRRSRGLSRTVLRARVQVSSGPQRRIRRLRLQLRDTLDSAQAAVDMLRVSEGPRGELPRLGVRIQKEGAALDAQLRLMESEIDPAVLADEIPTAVQSVDLLTGSVRRLRSAVKAGLGGLTEGNLASLRSEVDREVAAIDAGIQQLHLLNQGSRASEPTRQRSTDRLSRQMRGQQS
jgi:hypothetical protein